MKEASGELSMTLVTIIAVAAIAGAIAIFWPNIKNTINNKWGNFENAGPGNLTMVAKDINF